MFSGGKPSWIQFRMEAVHTALTSFQTCRISKILNTEIRFDFCYVCLSERLMVMQTSSSQETPSRDHRCICLDMWREIERPQDACLTERRSVDDTVWKCHCHLRDAEKHVKFLFAGVFSAESDVRHDEGNREGERLVWSSDWEQNNRYVGLLCACLFFILFSWLHILSLLNFLGSQTQAPMEVTQRALRTTKAVQTLSSGFTLQPAWLSTVYLLEPAPWSMCSVQFQSKRVLMSQLQVAGNTVSPSRATGWVWTYI